MFQMSWDYSLLSTSPRIIWGVLGTVFFLAALTDYKKGKIYNLLTGPVLLFSVLVVAVASFGVFRVPVWWLPLASAILAFFLSALLLFSLFALRVLAGGDVKLLVAVSPVFGAKAFLNFFFWSLAIAAIGSFALMLTNRRLIPFFKEIVSFFKSMLVPNSKVEWPKLRSDIKAPFGVAIFVGYIVHTFSEGIF